MPTTQEKITQLENDANKLVQNLELLYQKAGSYNAAKDELQKVNHELVQLINQTKSLSEESHKIISKINEIGSSKIFNQLEKIDRELYSFNQNSNSNFKTNKVLLIITIGLLTVSIITSILIYLK